MSDDRLCRMEDVKEIVKEIFADYAGTVRELEGQVLRAREALAKCTCVCSHVKMAREALEGD